MIRAVDCRRYVVDVLYLFLNGFGVFQLQTLAGAGCRTDAALVRRARRDDEHVAAQAGDGVGDVLADAHAAAQREHDKLLSDAQKELKDLAVTATEKLVLQSDGDAFDQFLDAAERGKSHA